MDLPRPLPGALKEFVEAVWIGRTDVRVLHSESDWPPSLWLVLAEQVPTNTPAIAVQDGQLTVGYRLVPLELDFSSWLILEATSYGRIASNVVTYDQCWKLEQYAAADRTRLSAAERARFRSRGYRFADE
jgi:hypothetical protein